MAQWRARENSQAIMVLVTRRELRMGPGVQPHDPSGVPGLRYHHAPGGQEPDLLEAAGLGVAAAAAYIGRQQSARTPHVDFIKK